MDNEKNIFSTLETYARPINATSRKENYLTEALAILFRRSCMGARLINEIIRQSETIRPSAGEWFFEEDIPLVVVTHKEAPFEKKPDIQVFNGKVYVIIENKLEKLMSPNQIKRYREMWFEQKELNQNLVGGVMLIAHSSYSTELFEDENNKPHTLSTWLKVYLGVKRIIAENEIKIRETELEADECRLLTEDNFLLRQFAEYLEVNEMNVQPLGYEIRDFGGHVENIFNYISDVYRPAVETLGLKTGRSSFTRDYCFKTFFISDRQGYFGIDFSLTGRGGAGIIFAIGDVNSELPAKTIKKLEALNSGWINNGNNHAVKRLYTFLNGRDFFNLPPQEDRMEYSFTDEQYKEHLLEWQGKILHNFVTECIDDIKRTVL